MTPINRFILHVVHNLLPLNEYSQGVLDKIIAHYREEADDLNISISDNQLKNYIERFDRIKPGIIQKGGTDLIKMGAGGKVEVIVPLSQLIRLISSRKASGNEVEAEEIDITPDVVYNNDNNTIVIYNGSTQDNCVRYGNGEKWCITRTSFPSYRYSKDKSYPTFYLAKNNNLTTSNKLSFVAIQVRNPETTGENNRYVYTDRTNNPNESRPMSFNQLMSEVPWLGEVPNIKSVLKYIPLSTREKMTQLYGTSPISYREWVKLPYSVKEQYLVIRKSRTLFSDINNEEFVEKYLPKYPELAKFIAETPGIVNSLTLLQNLDKFSNQIGRSITANIQTLIPTKYLSTELPFDVKKLLVKLNKWDLDPNERLYITQDGNTIVKLTLGDDMMVSLYQAEDDYPTIKLNKRTSKYLLDYPELDKIPLKILLDLAGKEAIDKDLITRILDNAKNDPNSAIIIKNVNGREIILDSNTFVSYEILENGNIKRVPFDDEDVQQIFNDSKDNEVFQQNVVSLFKQGIPPTVDKEALTSIINAIPYNQRIITAKDMPSVILSSNGRLPFFAMPSTVTPNVYSTNLDYGFYGDDWRRVDFSNQLGPEEWNSYFNYLRATNQSYSDDALLRVLNGMGGNSKKAFIANNPPVNNTGNLKPVMNGNTALLINRADPKNSRKVSDTGKLIKANIPSALARQLLGNQPAAAPAANAPAADNADVRRRGRPAGVPNAPRQQQPAAPAAQGNINVGARMQENGLETGYLALPRSIRNAINVINATTTPITNNRGASRRQNILGNAGRVTSVLDVGESTIYFIQLGNNTRIASLVKQPGNLHYIITPTNSYQLNSPSELLQVLQQRNLAEIRHYIVREYFERNPQHLNEFKQIFNEYITEKKKQNEVKRIKSSY
jgi:hypothetical protein